jgi:hypothetical protein
VLFWCIILRSHKTEAEWVGFISGPYTVIEKVGESRFGDRKYPNDVLKVKCKRGHEKNIKAETLFIKQVPTCRECNPTSQKNLGKVINNLKCNQIIYSKQSTKQCENFTAADTVKLECIECGKTKNCKYSSFMSGLAVCSACSPSGRKFTGKSRPITPNRYYGRVKRSAKIRGLEFNLSKEGIVKLLESQNFKCALSNMDISFDEGTASLDRINNGQGYTLENVQWLHKHVNFMKNTFEEQEFIDLCCKISDFKSKSST